MTTTNTKHAPINVSSEICLYGASGCGYDYLAAMPGTKGETVIVPGGMNPAASLRYDSLTAAVWTAADALRASGVTGTVAIYAPGGERVAYANLSRVPTFGGLRWTEAPVLTITLN